MNPSLFDADWRDGADDSGDRADEIAEARDEILACYEALEECKQLLEAAPLTDADWLKRAARLVRRIEVRILKPAKR